MRSFTLSEARRLLPTLADEVSSTGEGVVVTRQQALGEVWTGGLPNLNVVDRYVAYLRSKLGDPPLISTVRGVGFKLG